MDNVKFEDYCIDEEDLEGEHLYILMGKSTGAHGIELSEPIYASTIFEETKRMFEKITGRIYAS